MTRGVALAAVGTALALAAALLWPPCVPDRSGYRWQMVGNRAVFAGADVYNGPLVHGREYTTWASSEWPGELHLRWVGALDADRSPAPRLTAFSSQRANVAMLNALAASGPSSVHLPTLLAEVALVLLLGGGALTWVARRDLAAVLGVSRSVDRREAAAPNLREDLVRVGPVRVRVGAHRAPDS